MAWIRTISPSDATGVLKKIYRRIMGPDEYIDNILTVHSLRPHSLKGHMALYKNVLHNTNNSLSKWFLEALGVYVSTLNQCNYCVDHHFEGLKKLLDNDKEAEKMRAAFEADKPFEVFDGHQLEAFKYASKLTSFPGMVSKSDIEKLKNAGFDDGEILEINQVVAYFNYANRTVSGLGVNTKGDVLGLSPNDSVGDNWEHK